MEEDPCPPVPKGRRFSRPKLSIPMLSVRGFAPANPGEPVVQVPISAIPIANAHGPFGMMHLYPSKASEFVNKRYEGFKDFTKNTAKSGLSFGEKFLFWVNGRVRQLSKKWFTHMFLFLVVLVYSLVGAVIFVTVEGTHEEREKVDLQREFALFANNVRNMARDEKMLYNRELWLRNFKEMMAPYEAQLLESFSHGVTPSEHKVWSFWNSLFYCGTIYTTIGYGHISPSTTTGRAITIIYAIFGIPMFLILLADFGKLFTRGIKFLWAFVRRLYYTGSCKKVRKTAPVQEMMKGVQYVYDFAKNRRASQWNVDEHRRDPNQLHVPEGNTGSVPDTPGTPNLSAFEIDDEFNLPISVAITILLIYIFFGATIYWTWEDWSFFESFYFVFISMSTIGFGDFVPQNPVYMMASIIYLVFGLALTSMCINVVQEKLTDTFRQASTKIGATIGLRVAEDGTLSAPPELADVDPLQNVK